MFRFNITINGEDVTEYACYPFSGELTLDRALDQAYIELRATPRSKPYAPFSEVVITSIDDQGNEGESVTFVIASDEVETIVKTGRSNHNILLSEETKKLERVICPGKTFVQPLVREYTEITGRAEALDSTFGASLSDEYAWYKTYDNHNFQNPSWEINLNSDILINQLYTQNTITIPALTNRYGSSNYIYDYVEDYGDRYFAPRLSKIQIFDSEGVVCESYEDDETYVEHSVTLSYGEYYTLCYAWAGIPWDQSTGDSNRRIGVTTEFKFAVIQPTLDERPPLYITDVTNQLLEIAEPIRYGETPRYTLDPATARRYAKTPCNELNFANGATLRENLDEIAGIVQCITRLKNNVVYFDPVGSPRETNRTPYPDQINGVDVDAIVEPSIYADTNALGVPVSIKSSANIEKYATHLDSFVDNLMNAQDPKQGAVSDPFTGVYRTVRAETTTTDARVTVSNCRIDTVFPIEKLEQVTVSFEYDGSRRTADITPYVYERAEYDLLESYGGVYPYSKSFALYYVRGQKGIDGLTFKPDAATDLGTVFQNVAIENVIARAAGIELNWMDNIDGTEILNYAFNVTYIPTVRGRVRAAKRDISEAVAYSALAFNQGAPRLSSVNYGERLKGETAMLSEPEVRLVFKTNSLSAVVTSVGKLYIWNNERYYISKVTYKVWRGYVIAEMTLSRNFNQLGRFVSINNAFRQFEIDDTSQEECIVYEDYAVFSKSAPFNVDTSSSLSANISTIGGGFPGVLHDILKVSSGVSFAQTEHNSDIDICWAVTRDSEHNDISTALLPVQSLALGDSLMFNFSYQDNYSAGRFLQPQRGYKISKYAAYGDPLYGEAKYLYFELGTVTRIGSSSGATQDEVVHIGDRLPLNPTDADLIIDTRISAGTQPLIINKSSRDVPNITYQIHHVTDSGFILGKALTSKNSLVGKYDTQTVYFAALPFEVNPLSPPETYYHHYEGTIWEGEPFAETLFSFFVDGGIGNKSVTAQTVTASDVDINSARRLFIINASNFEWNTETHKSWGLFRRGDNDGPPEFLIGANGTPSDIYVYLTHELPNIGG